MYRCVCINVKKRVPHSEFAWEWVFASEFTVVNVQHRLGEINTKLPVPLFLVPPI